MPATIFSGSDVKTLKGNVDLNGNAKILTGTADPTSVAQNALRGSIYIRTGGSGGTAYIKADDGSSTNWDQIQVGAGSTANQYAAVVSDPAIAGFSTHTTLAAAIAAVVAGDTILYCGDTTENITIDKALNIEGLGSGAVLTGSVTFEVGSDGSKLSKIYMTEDLIVDLGVTGLELTGIILATGKTFQDSNGVPAKNIFVGYYES